jgi:hypothetical protein
MRSLSIFALFLFLALPSFAQEALPFGKGETIKYTIKKFGVGGKATLVFQGQQKTAGTDTYLIVFTADGFNFYDEEKIYVDTKTFSPVSVVRDINIFGKKEKITEEYSDGRIKITKVAGGETTVQTIEKKGRVDNIYGAIYRYRKSGSFKLGDQMSLRLPTIDITLKLSKMNKVATGGKKYDAYYMESVPSQYMVWFDTSPRKIPLRITGTAGMGKTNMVITGYEPGQSK